MESKVINGSRESESEGWVQKHRLWSERSAHGEEMDILELMSQRTTKKVMSCIR